MNDIRINTLEHLKYVDPAKVIPQLTEVMTLAAVSNLPDKVKNLRTNKLRRHRERWIAALFCYGQSRLLNTPIFVSPYEASDYDAVSKWYQNNTLYYAPIQIKEVISEDLNPYTGINQEIAKLEKYTSSQDLVVVIYVNRNERLEVPKVIVPKLNISQLWIMGACVPDLTKWFIAGDFLKKTSIFIFDYPF